MTSERGTWFARVIALVAAFDVVAMTQVPWGIPAPRTLTGADPFLAVARMPWLLFLLSCLSWGALYAFARKPERVRYGLLALAPSSLLQEVLARVQGGHEEPFFQPAGAILGWVVAIVLARALAERDATPLAAGDERRAGLAGATAVVGASYFNAGLSKLLAEGPGWALHPTHVRAMTLAHQPLPPTALDEMIIGAFGRSATLGRAAATFTLIVELGGAAFALSSRARKPAAIALVVWHLGLLYMTGICFYGGLILIVALGDRTWPERIERGARALRLYERRRMIFATSLFVTAVLALGWLMATSPSQRAVAAAVVTALACLAIAAAFRPSELAAGGEPRSVHRSALVVVVAVAAVVAGLYWMPITPHAGH